MLNIDCGSERVRSLKSCASGNRKYIKCVYLYNKIDTITIEEVDEIARRPKSVVCSVHKKCVTNMNASCVTALVSVPS